MLATITSGAVLGVDAYRVRVEVDLARGLPSMTVVGLPGGAVREARERVGAALTNAGFQVPPRRITINLAPADIPKTGSAFDLPIALALLAASGATWELDHDAVCCIGELGLDGRVRPVHGALAVALMCRAEGIRTLVVPTANAAEAAVVEGVEVRAADSLADVVRFLAGGGPLPPAPPEQVPGPSAHTAPDFADVRGQGTARRALEIAAAGGHNVLRLCPNPRAQALDLNGEGLDRIGIALRGWSQVRVQARIEPPPQKRGRACQASCGVAGSALLRPGRGH